MISSDTSTQDTNVEPRTIFLGKIKTETIKHLRVMTTADNLESTESNDYIW